MTDSLAALATVHLNWADTPDHVWRDSPYHVEGLHASAMAAIDQGIRDAAASGGPSPIGLMMQGQKGVGKTHLLGLARRQTHRMGGYFFLNNLTAADAFWDNTAEALREGLGHSDDTGEPQLTSFLRRVCALAGLDAKVTGNIAGGPGLTRRDVDNFVSALRSVDFEVAMECADTARALVLYASVQHSHVGYGYLGGFTESKDGERRKWGIERPISALTKVRHITRLLALTGPSVIAVDQLDTLVARSVLHTQQSGPAGSDELLFAQVADGLMGLREVTRRTLTLVAALPATWTQIKDRAADTVPDRFRESFTIGRITDRDLGRELVARWLGVAYREVNFTPPYPTWPVAPSAFAGTWEAHTPRELLKRIYAHLDSCVRAGQIRELTTFSTDDVVDIPFVEPVSRPDRFAELDAWFEELRSETKPSALLGKDVEDETVPELLSAALRCWITEVGDDDLQWACRTHDWDRNELHAWLTHTVDEVTDLEEHWAFRAIAAEHHLAVLSRLRKARAATGLGKGVENRRLILLRKGIWGKGTKTLLEVGEIEAMGGRTVELSEPDVRTFWALHTMLAKGGADFHEWLVDRRPASRSRLLTEVLPNASTGRAGDGPRPRPESPDLGLGTAVPLGADMASGTPVSVDLTALRKHAVVFAGSGSGKTVLLRRIVEECALRGVSAIVLDPNNDLARLGDAWPTPPAGWGPDDAALARQYLAGTDVVVWTPGRATGRPLAFQPLPDFAGVLDDRDEFEAAVEVAVATLAPQVRLTGNTARTNIRLAVLRQAITHHARRGSRSLPGLVDVLSDLPEGVSTLNDAERIAADLAEALKAAMVNDPLLAGGGQPVDPGLLLTPRAGRRARVSVISFVGLQAEEQRQNFVNQLQMELFAWIKRNPAGDRPLGALFVMDEAQTLAASGSFTASTRSTIVLASQARKYGLGLLFATQAPKGLHNQITGNAMTQFFGRLNSPAQIAAANELARAKGTLIAEISNLERAQFYVSGESFGFRKIATPLCLTHHPASPLRLEEVIDRARGAESGDGPQN